jgi:rhodanese-related sulfurtransferase
LVCCPGRRAGKLADLQRSETQKVGQTSSVVTIEDRVGEIGTGLAPLIDGRREQDFADDPTMLPGSFRGNPENWGKWAVQVPPTAEIVVYCVHGRAVSQAVQEALVLSGLSARWTRS